MNTSVSLSWEEQGGGEKEEEGRGGRERERGRKMRHIDVLFVALEDFCTP